MEYPSPHKKNNNKNKQTNKQTKKKKQNITGKNK